MIRSASDRYVGQLEQARGQRCEQGLLLGLGGAAGDKECGAVGREDGTERDSGEAIGCDPEYCCVGARSDAGGDGADRNNRDEGEQRADPVLKVVLNLVHLIGQFDIRLSQLPAELVKPEVCETFGPGGTVKGLSPGRKGWRCFNHRQV